MTAEVFSSFNYCFPSKDCKASLLFDMGTSCILLSFSMRRFKEIPVDKESKVSQRAG